MGCFICMTKASTSPLEPLLICAPSDFPPSSLTAGHREPALWAWGGGPSPGRAALPTSQAHCLCMRLSMTSQVASRGRKEPSSRGTARFVGLPGGPMVHVHCVLPVMEGTAWDREPQALLMGATVCIRDSAPTAQQAQVCTHCLSFECALKRTCWIVRPHFFNHT